MFLTPLFFKPILTVMQPSVLIHNLYWCVLAYLCFSLLTWPYWALLGLLGAFVFLPGPSWALLDLTESYRMNAFQARINSFQISLE